MGKRRSSTDVTSTSRSLVVGWQLPGSGISVSTEQLAGRIRQQRRARRSGYP
jgi:hypothetical protein